MENEFVSRDERPVVQQDKSQKSTKKKKKTVNKTGNIFIQILNGNFLLRDFVIQNIGYVLFVFFMLILLVSKGYYCKDLSRKIVETQRDVDAKNTKYYTLKERLEKMTRREILVKKLNPKGLYETTKPAKVIRIKNQED
jgi:cell division protein FtsL